MLAAQIFPANSAPNYTSTNYALHSSLAKHNLSRLAVGVPTETWEGDARTAFEYQILEGHYLEELRETIRALTPGNLSTADNFITWFESLNSWGPGQNHSLFDWLAHEATLDQMKWFLTQEVAAENDFGDLVAYTQVKLSTQAKLGCARDFWDEMGRGKQGAMRGPLIDRMVNALHLSPSIETAVWETLARNNTMVGLATTRRYAYHSIGALGVTELTSSDRAKKIAQGMKRLGMDQWSRTYYDLLAALDGSNARSWINEVIRPMVTETPDCAKFIAEGALMRLQCGKLCFDRYSDELGLANDLDTASDFSENDVRSNSVVFIQKKLTAETLRF